MIDSQSKLSTVSVRMLGTQDYSAVIEINSKHEIHFGTRNTRDSAVEFHRKLKEEYLNPEDRSRLLFGLFVNDTLAMTLGIYLWEKQPHCTLVQLTAKKDFFQGKEILVHMEILYMKCLSFVEEDGRTKFYFITQVSHNQSFQLAGIPKNGFGKKYLLCTEDYVLKNTQPRWYYAWDMMGFVTWPVDIVIRSGTLLDSFRKLDYPKQEGL